MASASKKIYLCAITNSVSVNKQIENIIENTSIGLSLKANCAKVN